MAEVDELQRRLLACQNSDGGWPFERGTSWTEPTALASLALRSHDNPAGVQQAALAWLGKRQNADGGWSPNDAVPTSTWVTSLVILALPNTGQSADQLQRAAIWVTGHVSQEPSTLTRYLLLALGRTSAQVAGASPWFPGTAGWVIPTSTAILALSRLNRTKFALQLEQSQRFLLSRRCSDGGWNHGGSSFRSENASSYAETTGLALLALAGLPSERLTAAFRLSGDFLRHPDSIEGRSWLQMGLLAHGKKVEDAPPAALPRTVRDISLRLLALAAIRGNNRLLTQA
jgi:hypothetical protein